MLVRGRTRASWRLLHTRAAMTIITLSSALMAFNYGGTVAEGNNPRVTNAPQTGATGSTAPRGPKPAVKPRDQRTAELTKQLEEAPDIEIKFDNSSDAPLAIKRARVRAVASPPVPGATRTEYEVRPDVELQNANQRRVTGLVLLFDCGGGTADDKAISGEGGLNVTPGADYQFKMRPWRETFRLYCDPNRLTVSVAAVLLEGEDIWVNVDQTRGRPGGGSGTRPPSSPGKPGSVPLDQSGPRPSAGSAKAMTDLTCIGYGCPVNAIKMLGEGIGLAIVFEAWPAEDRIRMADSFYLLNLSRSDIIEILLRLHSLRYERTGNQLSVKRDASPESLHRLTLATDSGVTKER